MYYSSIYMYYADGAEVSETNKQINNHVGKETKTRLDLYND